jgi:hypothetical protein
MHGGFPAIFSVFVFEVSQFHHGRVFLVVSATIWRPHAEWDKYRCMENSLYTHTVLRVLILRRIATQCALLFVCEKLEHHPTEDTLAGCPIVERGGYGFNISRLVTELTLIIPMTMTPCRIKFCHSQVGIRHQ